MAVEEILVDYFEAIAQYISADSSAYAATVLKSLDSDLKSQNDDISRAAFN